MNRQEIEFTALVSGTRLARNVLASLVPPLIPILAVALEYPLWQLGLLVTLFSLGSGVGQAPVGYLSDRYDRRYILPTGMTVAGASYLLFAAAQRVGPYLPAVSVLPVEPAYVVMAGSMLLCGLATSVVHPTVYPMITDNVAAGEKGKVLGLFGSAAKAGDATVPIVVGVLLVVLVWQDIVALVGAFGVAVGVVLFGLLARFETAPQSADAGPGDDRTDDDGWPDRRQYAYPMLVIYLFSATRAFAGRGLKTFVPAFIVAVYGYTTTVLGTDFAAESVANFYFSAVLFAGAATQVVVGWLVNDVDPRLVLIGFMGLATVGIVGLAHLTLPPATLLVVLLVAGVGIWGLNPARDILISRIAPAAREGRTFGYLWTANHLSGAFIPTLIGYMADLYGLRQSFAYLGAGTVLAAGVVALLYSDRVYRETEREPVRPSSVD